MRRTILIVPGMLSMPGADSFLRQKLPALTTFSEIGQLSRVAPIPNSQTPEVLLLGMKPDTVRLNQGPLTVSAFGFDPPEKSTHFHLSLMSFCDGTAVMPDAAPQPEEAEILLNEAKRLNGRLLTICKGEGLDHGLVWEAFGDLGTTQPKVGQPLEIIKSLPEGDGDSLLRRLIDDSINLLSELEINVRRVDEGLPPLNLLWPWGQGVRQKVPNLALSRGEPAWVESCSMRLAGLTRLTGYRHIDRAMFGRGLHTQFRSIADRATKRDLTVIYIDAPVELRRQIKPEELEWFLRELDRNLLQPLIEDHVKTPSRLTLIAPGSLDGFAETDMQPSPVGLALSAESNVLSSSHMPFDERTLEEQKIALIDLSTLVLRGLLSE